ncbi:MAG: adenylate/guanylate cyclase domain-containing protein [Alphaproteobacteria bacterium]|nr:adenylate/guanylate cyclase domain-containing protein [Alphaproteobacteria bacterium]
MLGLDWVGRLRLGTGIVLFVYVATHLANHALGLISLAAMESGRGVFLFLWRNWVGSALIYVSLIIHLVLVIYSLARRRTWRLPLREVFQVCIGLMIPPLLALHVVANRGLHEFYGVEDTYAYVIASIWVYEPLEGLRQSAAVVAAWFHGCLGMHMWLRLRRWYARRFTYLYTFAFVLPILALTGFISAGREVELLIRNPIWILRMRDVAHWPDPTAIAWAYGAQTWGLWIIVAVFILIPTARFGRDLADRIRGAVVISYPDGRKVTVARGTSVLEASRSAAIPHASVCGGRGRCSTCRIRIGRGREHIEPAEPEEQRVLASVGAPAGVRLACQTRPTHAVEVFPLLPPDIEPGAIFEYAHGLRGDERDIAIMFADLRAFTRFAEKKLPYDVVFVLNQYFRAMGTAIELEGGYVDKFIGDGIMALFGLKSDPKTGCRQALAAARRMGEALDEMNRTLADDLDEPLRMGIGIHTGTAIVGEIGYGAAKSVTAIGDAVNTASRLEPLTKEFASQLVVSADVSAKAGVELSNFTRHDVPIHGRAEPLGVYAVTLARDLPPLIGAER